MNCSRSTLLSALKGNFRTNYREHVTHIVAGLNAAEQLSEVSFRLGARHVQLSPASLYCGRLMRLSARAFRDECFVLGFSQGRSRGS